MRGFGALRVLDLKAEEIGQWQTGVAKGTCFKNDRVSLDRQRFLRPDIDLHSESLPILVPVPCHKQTRNKKMRAAALLNGR